ncbi:MAG: hemerythrin family protein [Gallionellaceae bacterium]
MATTDNWEESWQENTKLKWDPSLDMGHKIIDAEHCILHSLMVDFQEAATQHAPQEALISQLEEVMKYAQIHFASEEKIMLDFNYPNMSAHVQLHKDLLVDVSKMYSEFKLGKINATNAYEFLLNWFSFHTSHEDKKLVLYLNKSHVY